MECKICEWIENKDGIREKENVRVIYEDEKTLVIMSDKPKAQGHIIVFPKEHHSDISTISDELVSHYFFVASFAATAVFEGLGAQGTNIISNNGPESERRFNHFCINVLPRKEADGLEFKWEPKKDLNLEEIMGRIKDKTFVIGKEEENIVKISSADSPQTKKGDAESYNADDKENYLVKQLDRMP